VRPPLRSYRSRESLSRYDLRTKAPFYQSENLDVKDYPDFTQSANPPTGRQQFSENLPPFERNFSKKGGTREWHLDKEIL